VSITPSGITGLTARADSKETFLRETRNLRIWNNNLAPDYSHRTYKNGTTLQQQRGQVLNDWETNPNFTSHLDVPLQSFQN